MKLTHNAANQMKEGFILLMLIINVLLALYGLLGVSQSMTYAKYVYTGGLAAIITFFICAHTIDHVAYYVPTSDKVKRFLIAGLVAVAIIEYFVLR